MTEVISYVWGSLFVFSISLSILLTYSFLKEKNKRKLIFAIAFYLSSLSFLPLSFGITGGEIKVLLFQNIYYWASVPLLFAINISLYDQISKIKNFNKIFYIFISTIIITFLISFLPFNASILFTAFRQIFSLEIIFVSIALFIKNRERDNLYFFLSMISFTIGGVAMAQEYNYLGAYSQFLGLIFLFLIFTESKIKTTSKKGFYSYFSLEQELENTKKNLNLTEKRFKKLLNNSPDLIFEKKPDGTILTVNNAMANSLGQEPNDLIGKNVHNLLQKETLDNGENATFKCLEENKIITIEDERNGRYFLNTYIPMIDGSGENTVQVIAHDITNQKKTNQLLEQKIHELRKSELATLNIMEDFQVTITELKKAKDKIEYLNKNLEQKVDERTKEVKKLLQQKDDFIGHLGHDLRTPLTPLTTIPPLIKKQLQNQKSKEMMDIIIKNIDFIKNLVNNTLELAQLNSPSFTLKPREVSVHNEISELLETYQQTIDTKKLNIQNQIPSKTTIYADPITFRELLKNLIENALIFTPENGTITLTTTETKQAISIHITDTGIGLTKQHIEHVFDEFYKADDARHDINNSGLGLTICKKIVEKHGGTIHAKSQGLGKGSTFSFTLKNQIQNKT